MTSEVVPRFSKYLSDAPNIQLEAWTVTHELLQSPDVQVEAKLFAATTLKGKVNKSLSLVRGSVCAVTDHSRSRMI